MYLFIFGCAGSSFLYSLLGLSLAVVSKCYSLWCWGFSQQCLLLLRNTGSRMPRLQYLQHTDSVVVVHGLTCFEACGIFPDQGLNLCPPHWQADSYLLHHQGSPHDCFISCVSSIQLLGTVGGTVLRRILRLGLALHMGVCDQWCCYEFERGLDSTWASYLLSLL